MLDRRWSPDQFTGVGVSIKYEEGGLTISRWVKLLNKGWLKSRVGERFTISSSLTDNFCSG